MVAAPKGKQQNPGPSLEQFEKQLREAVKWGLIQALYNPTVLANVGVSLAALGVEECRHFPFPLGSH